MNASFFPRQNPSNEKFTSHPDQDLKLKSIRFLQLFHCIGRLIISYFFFNQSGTSNCTIPAELRQVISEINLYLPGNHTLNKTLQFLGKNKQGAIRANGFLRYLSIGPRGSSEFALNKPEDEKMNTLSVKRKVSNQIITANFENINTKIVYPIIIGLCFMLCGMKSSAQCSQTITVDAWSLVITDSLTTHAYTCTGQVWNSDRTCYSAVHPYGAVVYGPNSMSQYAYANCHNYDGCTYWIHVVVTRSDNATRTVDSSAQLPDLNYHISPGTLYVKFN